MSNLIVFAMLVIVVGVVSIEFGRTRKDFAKSVAFAAVMTMHGVASLPAWYGHLTLLAGIAGFIWSGFVFQHPGDHADVRRGLLAKSLSSVKICYSWLKSTFSSLLLSCLRATKRYHQDRDTARPANQKQLWLRTLLLVVFSPLLAMPATLVMVVILWSTGAIVANNNMTADEMVELPKFLLGTAFVYWLVTLDLAFRNFAVFLPLLAASSYCGISLAVSRQQPWRYYGLAIFTLAALYPLSFLFAHLSGEFNEPFFN